MNNLCSDVLIPQRESIFRGLEYDRGTKKIYTSCGTLIGTVKRGKIYWLKKQKNA